MSLGPPEIVLILLVLILLFGAKKLPELARGSGRALRIFKSETKGLMDDDDDDPNTPNGATVAPPAQITQASSVPAPQPVNEPVSYPSVPPVTPQPLPPTHTEQ